MPEESTGSEAAAPEDGDLESSVPPETADIPEYMDSVADPNILQPGDIVRRQAPGKDHQGRFARRADDGGLIVEDIIDLAKHEYLAEAGILRTGPDDRIFVHKSYFADDAPSREAFEVLANWALWREHPELRGVCARRFFTGADQGLEKERQSPFALCHDPASFSDWSAQRED